MYLTAFILACCWGCHHNNANGWQQENIVSALHNVFPGAASVTVLDKDGAKVTGDDFFHLPAPLYKASVRLKNHSADDYQFYFYDGSPLDTAVYAPLLKQIIRYDISAAMESQKQGYLLLMPYLDSTNSNKLLVYGFNQSTVPDSAILVQQHYQLLHQWGLKSRSMEVHVSKDMQ
ncbi:MAG: hypothetical protein JST86_10960 [Bacteroidetes bacterium]|nr:hypothetical protein [Bacteroidota bacterium]